MGLANGVSMEIDGDVVEQKDSVTDSCIQQILGVSSLRPRTKWA